MAFTEQQQQLLGPQALAIAAALREVALSEGVIDQAYAATLATPTLTEANTIIVVAALTGNTTVPAPLGARKGMRLTYLFTQDGVGTRTVTWNAVHAAGTNGAGAASTKGAITFVYDGSRWVATNGPLAYAA